MHDTEFDIYLDLLTRFLRLNPRQRTEIRRELRAHLSDALAEAAERGETADDALRRVLDDFGDAAELAARFRTSHKKQRWMMHATLSAACAAFALVTFSFFSPPAQQASAARSRGSEAATAHMPEQAADAQIRAALNKVLPEVKFEDMPLRQALEWVQASMNVNVHVQWKALEDEGVAADTPVTFALKNVSVERLLRMVIDELETPVAYAIQDGVLTISTRERLRRHLRTQVYDVRDLLDVMHEDGSVMRGRASAMPSMLVYSDTARGKNADPSATEKRAAGSTDAAAPTAVTRSERLVDLIIRMVDPDTWQPNGGNASIEEFNGVLVIRQFDTVHSQVRELLDSLRSALATEK
jgi:hypothetical protein